MATIGTILGSNFAQRLPGEVHAQGSIYETLRSAKAAGRLTQARSVKAFTDSMALGLRGIAFVVLMGALLVARSYGKNRRSEASSDVTAAAPA